MNATIDSWLITDSMGEYVAYYNPTGHVMHFTRIREEAMTTSDSEHAFNIARIAQKLYQRKWMRAGLAN